MAANFQNNHWSFYGMLTACLAGLVASSLALKAHYGGGSAFCEIGEKFSCDAVNQSVYSQIYGIPWSLIGILGFIAVIALTLYSLKNKDEWVTASLIGMSIAAVAIQGYLTYIEAFVLSMWCLLCLASQISVLLLIVSSATYHKKTQAKS